MQQRRGAPVEVVLRIVDVVIVKVADGVGRQQVALAVGGVRGVAAAHVGGGIDQQLEGDRQVAGVARQQRDHRRQVAARAVAADRQARRIEPERAGLRAHPARGGVGVFDGRGEAVLRRHAVVDRHHRAARAVGQLAAQRVMRVEIADDPAAAVVVDQHRQRARAVLPIGRYRRSGMGPCGPSAARSRTSATSGGIGLREEAPLAVEVARVDRRQRVRGRNAAFDHAGRAAHGLEGGAWREWGCYDAVHSSSLRGPPHE